MSDSEVKTESVVGSSDAILKMNGLKYSMPQSLSTTVNKTFIRQYAQRQSYAAGETIIFDINTGSRYVDPTNSALLFDVSTTGSNAPFSSDAGAIALINEIRIFAKNGVELDRIQEVNQYVHTTSHYKDSSDAIDRYATLYGRGETVQTGAGLIVMIPMSMLSGLFNPIVKGMKLPGALISGARIELVLEKAERAFNAAGITGYTITNPKILMMGSELNDNTQRVLNSESAQNGLEYTYPRVFTTTETSAQTTVNIQVKKAVSQGLRAICVPVDSAVVESKNDDSFSSVAGGVVFTDYQYRIGSNFYPQQKIDSLVESYYVTQNSFNKNTDRSWYAGSLSINEYATSKYGVGAGFETDSRLNLSGVPINNSATLELQGSVDLNVAAVKYYVFMEYVAVSRSFLTNTTLKL
jgi:hypothetical protein